MVSESEIMLTCRQCGKQFVFSESEQQFYQQRGYTQPVHCRECRASRRSSNALVCAGCGKKIERPSDARCAACMETFRLELEMEARRLNTALRESDSKAEALEAEKAQLTDRLNSMLATAESEKAQLMKEAEARLSSLEAEKNQQLQEIENSLQAVESEKACLATLLEHEKQIAAELLEKINQAHQELEKANRYRTAIDYLEPTLKGIRSGLESLQRSQEDLHQAILQTAQARDGEHHNGSLLEMFKRLFRINGKSVSTVN